MNDDEEASFEAICGKRVVSPKIEELQTECRKYEEAHKMASGMINVGSLINIFFGLFTLEDPKSSCLLSLHFSLALCIVGE